MSRRPTSECLPPHPEAAGRRLVHDAEGLNSGTWPQPDRLITPVGQFFTRSHAVVPRLDLSTWRLEVGGLVQTPRSFSIDELTRMGSAQQVVSTLICAGLRRQEFFTLGPLPGELPWGAEAISTGWWTGIPLRELLDEVGIAPEAREVEFEGLDRVERRGRQFGFGGSIDLTKALAPEVTLAWALNGAPLTPEHGFPLRAIVPGWLGARSVKWLGRITLLAEPSSNYFQQQAYRLQRDVNPLDPCDVSAGVALDEVPVNSVILEPVAERVVPAGRTRVCGWAIGAGGRPLAVIQVSSDNGTSWSSARLSVEGRPWTWSFWEAYLELAPGLHSLVVRAFDSAGNCQPAELAGTWNVKGYHNNAWHRVSVQAV